MEKTILDTATFSVTLRTMRIPSVASVVFSIALSVTALPSAVPALEHPQPSAGNAAWEKFSTQLEEAASKASPTDYKFVVNGGGGTSVYLLICAKDGKPIGAILPENSATSIEGELVSYRLADWLGFPELSQRATPFTIRGKMLDRLKDDLRKVSFSGQKEANRLRIIERINAHPNGIVAVCKQWTPDRPINIESLRSDGKPNGRLNTNHPLAGWLRRENGMPTGEEIRLKEMVKAPAPALELTRQLSNIMVVDALTAQWDRFSGGNIQAYAKPSGAQLVALDNGGASLGAKNRGYLDLFKGWVTRFDQATAKRLLELDDFLQGKSDKLQGQKDRAAFLTGLGLEAKSHAPFTKRLAEVAAHVREQSKLPGGVFK